MCHVLIVVVTRKYDKLCIVTFNRIFHYDDVIQMIIISATTYQNLGENVSPLSEIISIKQRQK